MEEGNQLVHSSRCGEAGESKTAGIVGAEAGEARTLRIEVCRGLRGEIAETTETRSAGLSETAVIAEVVVTGKEGNASGESRSVKC